VIDMELLSVIRRWHYRDHFSIREISRRTGLSRNTVRKYLRSDSVEPKFAVPDRPSRLDPYADKLSHMLRQEAGKSRKQKRTVKQLQADPVALGYDGSYNRVVAARRLLASRVHQAYHGGENMLSTVLIVVLVLALIGALPTWPYSSGWGYYPSGGLGIVVLVVLVLLLTGRL